MTPGTYLRKRREAAQLSRDTVATWLMTDPPVPSRTRSEWIKSIEADAYPVPAAYVMVIERGINFDPAVLDALVFAQAGVADVIVPPICRQCGCSELDACWGHEGDDHVACAWAEPDLCTACAAPSGDVLKLTPEQQLPPAVGAAA